jgi:hypothetical protein
MAQHMSTTTSPADAKVQARMRKLLALAERGEGGEKENAQRMLEKMLDRHGMTMRDLIGEKRELRWFAARGTLDKRLIRQIAAKVLNSQFDSYRSHDKPKLLGIETTPAEAVEIELHIEALRPALADHLEIAFSAFVQANALFRDTSSEPSDEPTAEERARARQIVAMASATSATPVHKRLTA